jgi:hypothetical protein
MIAVIPAPVLELPERWAKRIADRRTVPTVDPVADSFELAMRELNEAIDQSRDAARLVSTSEYAALHGVRPSTVRKWCARGQLAGAQKNGAMDWMIPAGATRRRRVSRHA